MAPSSVSGLSGGVLSWLRRLSANNTTSCASCHVQAHAFADPSPSARDFTALRRIAAPCRWSTSAITSVRDSSGTNGRQPRGDGAAAYPKPDRDGTGPEAGRRHFRARPHVSRTLRPRLRRSTDYRSRIGKALAQFVRSIVSYQSRYDEGRARAQSAQDNFDNFTLQEIAARRCSCATAATAT